MKPKSLPRSFGGAQFDIITAILGHMTPCASPTTNRSAQTTPQWNFAPHGINVENTPAISIAVANTSRAPYRPARYPPGTSVIK